MQPETDDAPAPSWQPIGSVERRVLGVLVEKAKTTPDAYPLTVNAITTGSNQKSNRSPLMQLDSIDVENALDQLRSLGAVSEVHGSGRTAKYRHRFYEWMGVEKQEAAVMAELLLRGEQTIGELRGRAARMSKIGSVSELQPVLRSLMDKGLVQALTPAGRGQVVTHCLYLPDQQAKLQRNHQIENRDTSEFKIEADSPAEEPVASSPAISAAPPLPGLDTADEVQAEQISDLQNEVEKLRDTVSQLERRLENLEQLIN